MKLNVPRIKSWLELKQLSLLTGTKIATAAVASVGLAVSFQNCSGFKTADWANGDSARLASLSSLNSNCNFNGNSVSNGQAVPAYLNSTGSSSTPCQSEQRTCANGILSGSFEYGTCANDIPAACLFNGQTYASGSSVTAFEGSTVPFGQSCSSQQITCTNGAWSGTAAYASCTPGAPASCIFNGQTIPSGQAVAAFLNSSATNGQQCSPEGRVCTNGVLSGSYTFGSCTVVNAASCMLGGATVNSGSQVQAFQNSTVPFGQRCTAETRLCSDGQLSGSYSFTSCAVDQPASCLFNGLTVLSGANVTAFQTSTVAYGQVCVSEMRSCSNGTLSGIDTFSSCVPDQPAACTFNGQTYPSGQTVRTFTAGSVPFGSQCSSVAQQFICNNGSFGNTPMFANCVVNQPAPCLFLGQTFASGQQTSNAFSQATVPFGQSCSSVQAMVTCTNGALTTSTGSSASQFISNSCVTQPAASCSYNGQMVSDSQNVTAFSSASVPAGQQCFSVQSTLTCSNGVFNPLASAFPFGSCVMQQDGVCGSANGVNTGTIPSTGLCAMGSASSVSGTGPFTWACVGSNGGATVSCSSSSGQACTFNGQTIPGGGSVTVYQTSTVPYGQSCSSVAQTETCSNGQLSGNYMYGNCAVAQPPTCNIPLGPFVYANGSGPLQSQYFPPGSLVACEQFCASQNAVWCEYEDNQLAALGGQPITSYCAAFQSTNSYVNSNSPPTSNLYSGPCQ